MIYITSLSEAEKHYIEQLLIDNIDHNVAITKQGAEAFSRGYKDNSPCHMSDLVISERYNRHNGHITMH